MLQLRTRVYNIECGPRKRQKVCRKVSKDWGWCAAGQGSALTFFYPLQGSLTLNDDSVHGMH